MKTKSQDLHLPPRAGERRNSVHCEAQKLGTLFLLNVLVLSILLFLDLWFWRFEKPPLSLFSTTLLSFLTLLSAASFTVSFFSWQELLSWGRHSKRLDQDTLTGALTHLSFEETLLGEIRRAGRYRYPVVLCRLDLDDFASLNQHVGRERADELLKRFTTRMRGAIRFTDLVARYEADEFCVLLPHTPLLGAQKFISRLLAESREHEELSFCAGLTAYSTGENATRFLIRAGEALKTARHEGRGHIHSLAAEGIHEAASVIL